MSQAPSARPAFASRPRVAPDASVLVLFCHPVRHRSRVNGRLAEAARGIRGVTVHDLYEAYPDFAVDVAYEQQLLARHDVVVMQHPFFWYSTPALLKEWQDHVLTYGWAYGHGGRALQGKRLLTAVTTGGPAPSYQPDGTHGVTVRALLAPIAQTARLCGMAYLPPLVVHGTHRLEAPDIDRAVDDYVTVLEALRDDRLDVGAVTPAGSLDTAAVRGGA